MRCTKITPALLTGLLAAGLASLAVAVPASAVTTAQLERAHWDCVPAPPVTDELHCARPGGLDRMFSGQARTLPMLVFDESGKTFLGTEINVRGDIFNHQPCPKDPPSYRYTHLDFLEDLLGIDYWACHHFDSDHT
jgi:hypothetical protein